MARPRHPTPDFLTPPDIAEAPERAALAVLAVALETAAYAIIAEWPELAEFDPYEPNGRRRTSSDRAAHVLRHAKAIIEQAGRLGNTVHRYRVALADFLEAKAKTDHPQDAPF